MEQQVDYTSTIVEFVNIEKHAEFVGTLNDLIGAKGLKSAPVMKEIGAAQKDGRITKTGLYQALVKAAAPATSATPAPAATPGAKAEKPAKEPKVAPTPEEIAAKAKEKADAVEAKKAELAKKAEERKGAKSGEKEAAKAAKAAEKAAATAARKEAAAAKKAEREKKLQRRTDGFTMTLEEVVAQGVVAPVGLMHRPGSESAKATAVLMRATSPLSLAEFAFAWAKADGFDAPQDSHIRSAAMHWDWHHRDPLGKVANCGWTPVVEKNEDGEVVRYRLTPTEGRKILEKVDLYQ